MLNFTYSIYQSVPRNESNKTEGSLVYDWIDRRLWFYNSEDPIKVGTLVILDTKETNTYVPFCDQDSHFSLSFRVLMSDTFEVFYTKIVPFRDHISVLCDM